LSSPTVPGPAPPDKPQLFYRRGRRWPRAIAWFGFKSFWGHLWHLVASVVATEDIDSRDWMQPDDPADLGKRIAKELGVTAATSNASLTDAMGRDVWIDFVADTGDDFSISKAVAKLVTAEYEVAGQVLPRGDILIFGGDTAYPVATDIEIHNRVVVPWNQVLKNRDDGKSRVILGIPGNHDWFAGLDGFGRMFRRRRIGMERRAKDDARSDDEVDRLGQIGHLIEWVEAFRVGKDIYKRAALALRGYTPVQSASYFRLALAPKIEMWGVDRQLRSVDFQQRAYFAERSGSGVVLCVADPIHAFLEPNPPGIRTLAALGLSLEQDGPLVLTGDTHHYCRQTFGKCTHVIAGGGGAFLHPACIARVGAKNLPDAEFPGPKTTLALALQVPWQIVHGRSGFLIHGVLALFYGPLFFVQWATGSSGTAAAAITSVVATLACIGLGGWRHKFLRIALLSVIAGLVMGFLPTQAHLVAELLVRAAKVSASHVELAAFAYAIAVYGGTLALGTYLMLLTVLGLEQHQALSALAHPGYKHFVRLRVRADGSAIDAWVLGRVDPLHAKDAVVLVDAFSWKNPGGVGNSLAG
jgi:hypothetical protein